MRKRLILNDLRANKLSSFAAWAFMTLCALLMALSCFLFSEILGSLDILMEAAQTPGFLQMHSGDIDENAIAEFADKNDNVIDHQILKFLNIENGTITLGDRNIADSTQDNGVCVQSERFDRLLDTDNNIITVSRGEVYVPACYKSMYGLSVGEEAVFGEKNLKIAGFLRDSQMNCMMSSSKRFLVNEADYNDMLPDGNEEYIIEFLLSDDSGADALAAAYSDAALPANGPSITKPLIRLMNALSDGMTALIILLVSVVMLLISVLCIRFILLSRLEGDRREIGMLKAVGISRKDVRGIYFSKYLLLSAIGCAVGLIAAYPVKIPMQKSLKEIYGSSGSGFGSFIIALIGVLAVEGLILLSVHRTLKSTEKMSTVEALRGESGKNSKINSQSVLIAFVIAAGVFLMIVPQNMSKTISSPEFVTHMGIGQSSVRMDIRQTEDIEAKSAAVSDMLADDGRVSDHVNLITKSYRADLADGTHTNLKVETGDHTAFPVAYASGHAPTASGEIALSYLCADDLKLATGDIIRLDVDGEGREFTVCGIYSDITNGGKTAKSTPINDSAPVMWSVFYISLNDDVDIAEYVDEYEALLSAEEIPCKVVDVAEYVTGTYGSTMNQISLASTAARCAATIVIFIVVMLFAGLTVAREKYDISLKKALGFTGRELKLQYAARFIIIALIGVALGIVLGNWLGQSIVGIMFGSLGAVGFRFIIDGLAVFFLLPLLAMAAVCAAVVFGIGGIDRIKAYECCMGKE